MAVSGTLGAMLQGVSQQPAYLRSDGQVTDQLNFMPDVTRGLTSRPGAVYQNVYNDGYNWWNWVNVELKGEYIQLGVRANNVIALKSDGTLITVTGGSNSYISTDMVAYVYDDKIYLLSRDVVVAASTTTVLPTGAGRQTATVDSVVYDLGTAYATSFGGKYGVTYTMEMTYSDATVATGSFTTPDGSVATHTADITADNIISKLQISLSAHGNFKATSTATQSGSVLMMEDSAVNFTIKGDDGDGGFTFKVADQKTKTIEAIPVTAVPGAILRVVGENGAVDDLWFRFEGIFGEKGQWVETFNPQQPHALDLSTMPVILEGDVSGLTLSQGDWQGRQTGDDETNPMPSFVGSKLRDVTGFQSRVVVISEQSVVMSRTNLPVDFFRSSAAERLVTDRIDMYSTTESDYSLEWCMPFDRDLVIWGKKSQFLVLGGQALTPSNASIVQTTNFETDALARPVSTGRTILFPFQEGAYAGVKEFYSANSVDANEAISITKVQSRFIPGQISKMANSTNFSTAVCWSNATNRVLYVYQYYFDGEKKVQSAWYRMQLEFHIANFFFRGSILHILMKNGTELQTHTIDFSLPASAGVPFHICLDSLTQEPAATDNGQTTQTTSFRDGLTYVQGTGCAKPGQLVTPESIFDTGSPGSIRWEIEFNPVTVPVGARVWSGVPYTRDVKPTMPLVRDQEGKPISNAKLTVGAFIIYYEDSGSITATRSSRYRAADTVFTNNAVPMANDPEDLDETGVKSGIMRINWGERSDWSELSIGGSDVRPITITEIEWEGQIQSRGRRM